MQTAVAMHRLRQAAERPDGGIEIVRLPMAMGPAALLREATPDVIGIGYVPIVVHQSSEPDLPRPLLHRHLLVICEDSRATVTAIRWVRALAQASPRAHIVVTFDEGERRSWQEQGDVKGIEQETERPDSPTMPARVAVRIARAERWLRKGRGRMADRWLVAAAETARRRSDPALAGFVEAQRIRRLLDSDRVDEAARGTRALLVAEVDWPGYVQAAGLWTDVLIARELPAAARAWTTSVVAEAVLRGVVVPSTIRSRIAELDFWQGRDRDPASQPPPGLNLRLDTPEEIGWTALSAWRCGNHPQLALLTARLSTRQSSAPTDDRISCWLAVLRVLSASSAPDAEHRITELVRAAEAASSRSRRFGRLAAALSARVWMNHHQCAKAAAIVATARGPGLEGRACQRLQAAASAGAAGTDSRGSLARRPVGPPGVEFLVQGRSQMCSVDGLSSLLAVIEEADDDAAVLSGGCRWLCRQAGAAAAAIVSADGGTMLAAEGWRRPDLAGEIRDVLAGAARDIRQSDHDSTAPAFGVSVRYGGTTIGTVVARGRQSDRPGIQQAALALATLCGSALRARLDSLTTGQRAHASIPEMVGHSPLIASVRDAIMRAASVPFPVLIEGESGTGKELVARALHRLGARRDRRLCTVNCAALTDELVEAELFGHTRGAFTGAVGPRTGLFEEAHGGTLFLDEVTELSPRAQAKLLRVLQEREVRRVGENAPRAIDVRVIAACNIPMADAVAGGRFRDDLRFRLAVVRIHVPALRDRPEDIPTLARLFWKRCVAEAGTRALLGPDALVRLARHAWPGNVRELQNVVAGLVVAAPARGRVSGRHVDQILSQPATVGSPGLPLEAARRTFERRVIAAALVRHAGRRAAAASELGLSRQGLTKALRRLGLSSADEPAGAPAGHDVGGLSARDDIAGLSAHDDIAGVA